MTLAITAAHNDARLAGTLAYLDTGSGNARIRIYSTPRPPSVNDAPTGVLLAEFTLTDPAGVVAAHALTLTQSADAQVQVSGTPAWARIVNGNGDTVADADVTALGAGGDITLSEMTLYAGGFVTLVAATLT